MQSQKRKKILLVLLGTLVLFFLASMGWVFVKILTRPGPRQEQLEKLKSQKTPLDPQVKKLEELQNKYEKAIEQIENMPDFSPPGNGLITPEQMKKFADVFNSVVMAVEEVKKLIPEGKKSLGEGLIYLNQMYLTAQGTHAIKLLEHKMSPSEYEWVGNKIREAEIVALLKLDKLTENEEEKKKIRACAKNIAEILGYAITDERGELIGQPEMLDPNNVPPQHIRYVLEYYPKLGQPDIWLNQLDWAPLLKSEGMELHIPTPPPVNPSTTTTSENNRTGSVDNLSMPK